ncbi:hypothetical protein [Helicobacter pylori]|uniref:Uncharacterized protein n=1 Tax=Helicobacter pylori Hp P-15 TaxID=992080 RepID=J0QC45_HELPX|nr:hypothetical protein [Helicobacter pylori]EJC08573.1 hypothetical protein HPHPP15_0542 [Helicobacter pylori Hp P-15]EJC33162.1 hypothetical protein HPHPP15B_0544 [Helicobacter pylori Hp P-15b]
MLLDYDFLLLLNDESGNPTRYYYLLQDFEKDFVASKVAQNRVKRFVKEIIGREKASKTKNSAIKVSNTKASAIENETIGNGDLKKACEKIKSGLPFGIAFKPFKDAFYRVFNHNEQKLLIGAAKSGCIQSSADKLAQLKTRLLYWQDKSVKVDWDKPILIKDFFKGNNYLYRRLCFLLGKHFIDRFLKNNAKASVKDFMSSKEFVAKYRYTPKQNTERAKKLQSYLEGKRDFIGFIQTLNSLKDNPQDPFLPSEETSFLVFANEPTIVFNLRDYLLVLAQIFNQQAICYCESKCPIELINASPGNDFDKTQDSFSDIKFSTPNQLEQSLNDLKNKLSAFFSKHHDKHNGMEFNEIAKTQIEALCMPHSSDGFDDFREHLEESIKSFIRAKKNRYGFPKIFDVADIEQEEREVIEWREKNRASKQSYKQNLQINKIANDLKRNKVVDKRTILSVIDADLERGFIPPKDLLKQLEKISASLSKDIVIAIKQVEKLELNYALIDNIQHNTLDDTLDFTFIVGDSLSVQSLYVTFHLVIDMDRPMSEQFLNHIGKLGSFKSRERALEWVRLSQTKLIIEAPREALKNAELSQIEEILIGCIFNGAYRLQNDLKGNRHENFKQN